MLEDTEAEAILICTPNWLHADQAVPALNAGKHVFCEKPLGIDLTECDEILAAWKRANKGDRDGEWERTETRRRRAARPGNERTADRTADRTENPLVLQVGHELRSSNILRAMKERIDTIRQRRGGNARHVFVFRAW